MMKANELMIGDWVMYQDKPIQIQFIYNDGYDDKVAEIEELYSPNINEIEPYLTKKEISIKDIEPIPLTSEILEKNGWKRDLDKEWKYNNSHILPRYCYQWERQSVKIEIDAGLDGFTTSLIIGRRFYAVHKLQHALCLCGLDEWADNFQV